MIELKIDKSVPPPKKLKLTETFRRMKVGDSVLIPKAYTHNYGSYVYLAAMRANIKVTVKVTEEGPRVWRIE